MSVYKPSKLIEQHLAVFGSLPHGIICRHAERPHLEKNSKYQGLNPAGLTAAFDEGTRLNGNWRLYSSPVERCRQTALALAWGINYVGGRGDFIADAGWLGGDLLYKNHSAAMDIVFSKKLWDFMPNWKAGELSAFTSFDEFFNETCQKVGSILLDGPAIFVSHDINLIVLADKVGQHSEKKIYFQFLEGVTLIKNDRQLGMFAWHDGTPVGTWVTLS
jgi:hypothetical protein